MTMTFHDHLVEQVRKKKGTLTNQDKARIEDYLKTDGGKEAYRAYQENNRSKMDPEPARDDSDPSRPMPPKSEFVYRSTPAIAEKALADLREKLKALGRS